MKVSVIVPVYRVEEYLSKCIESVLNQTYHDFELILVNDGSPDNSGKICDEYAKKDSRIKVIHKENGGPASCVNRGIKESTGEYITFSDSDDWLEPDYLKELYNGIYDNNCDMAICDYKKVYAQKEINVNSCKISEGISNKRTIKNDILPFIITEQSKNESSLIAHSRCAKIFKRELLINNFKYFREDVRWGEDFLMTLSCLCDCEKINYLKGLYLYNYRFNHNSLTQSYNKTYFKEYYELTKHLKTIAEEKNISENNQIYYQYINCFISAVNVITFTFGKYKRSEIIKEIKKVINSEELSGFKFKKNIPLNKKQKIYMFLIRNRLSLLIYILLLYFHIKKKILK